MADYPATIYAPRAKENWPNVVYTSTKKTIIFKEDFDSLENEIKAIENELGLYVKGNFGDLVERLESLEDNQTKYLSHVEKTGSFTTNSTSWVDITNLSITITTEEKRVLLMVSSDIFNDTAGGRSGFSFDIDGTTVNSAGWGLIAQDAISAQDVVPFCMTYITDVLSAGSHTFKVRMKVQTGTNGSFAGTAGKSIFTALQLN